MRSRSSFYQEAAAASIAAAIALACAIGTTSARAAEKPAAVDNPAVNCSTAPPRSLERLMCRSATLSALDREMNRVLALATRAARGNASAQLTKDQADMGQPARGLREEQDPGGVSARALRVAHRRDSYRQPRRARCGR